MAPRTRSSSFAPLLDPDLPKAQLDALAADLASASFHPDKPDAYVAPSYDLLAADFDERRYWRGPVWINTNWLLWWGLRQHGLHAAAEEVLMSSVGSSRARASTSTSTRSPARGSGPAASAGPPR